MLKNQTPFDAAFTSERFDVSRYGDGSKRVKYVPAGSTPRSAAPWLTVTPATFDIGSVEERHVRLVLDVPQDAGSGGAYVALVFEASQDSDDVQVDVDASIPVMVLVTVRGDFRRGLEARVAPRDRWRWSGGRSEWEVELENTGDVHEVVAAGSVSVDGLLSRGRRVALEPGILLPGERRRQRVDLEVRAAPDVLAAEATIEREGADDLAATSDRTVVLPWWLLVVLAAGVGLVAWRAGAGGARSEPLDQDDDVEPSIDPGR